MEIINDKGEIRKVFKSLMDKHRKYFWVTRFARSTFPFIFDLADHESKIFKIAVGLNGLETSPTFINEFLIVRLYGILRKTQSLMISTFFYFIPQKLTGTYYLEQ
ncbi:MAG: hypothetical protein IPN55_08820 [Saprospiraceae bacterium]|nr:hypothetical protein [Candidatus Brachybacter algidus]